ncbi:DUF2252 domain-containing protein [Crenobacter sp. SG2303]|uniref:DUF2252 domain-containing protein n=1 Tax=Crenobacter oryzisoli TaxID=3056844 RepID=A0ABT7XMM1_9NEIS|nr:DUF2252 domain-containing protein [Crenobacter sp. SG2303]MDN0075043.1 DUF2252 domain-containing protein [Crenobacter sp. SG2303]
MATLKKKYAEAKKVGGGYHAQVLLPRSELIAAGKATRTAVPRESHAEWSPSAKRRDPVDVLEESNRERLAELVPIRYGRMLRSAFTFLRGSAGLMAYDLSNTPTSGIRVQACGDCHLLNFGLFATPERNLIFDINDFDETLPAPWEWDVKRLAASFAVAARDDNLSDKDAEACAIECVRAYRERMRMYSKMSPLEVWYHRLDVQTLIDMAPGAEAKKRREAFAEKARSRVGEYLAPKIVESVEGHRRLVDQPPVLFHMTETNQVKVIHDALEAYRLSLPDERRCLFDNYRLADIAVKVVGIGSVGTRCLVGLFFSADDHPLLLQFKEACPSVLEPYAGKSLYDNHGQRVVIGQRLMQSSSDIFLGWTHGQRGFHYFGRQLRDMKFSLPLVGLSAEMLKRYAEVCGWTLAHAHAKSSWAAASLISGYLGKSTVFDEAIGKFALAYAAQTLLDHTLLVAAVNHGRVEALIEEDL